MTVSAASVLLTLESRRRREQARAQERAESLLRRLPEAVLLLTERHGASRAWLFGSLATGGFRLESDVDLAVEGLPAGALFPAAADLMALLEADVDLVRIEEATESLRSRILAEGRPL
jgi:predicted nucleotidyltransferase